MAGPDRPPEPRALFGLEMFRALARSQATIYVHIAAAGRCTGNIRLFEATGVGACLVTDWKEDLGDLFELDREVVSYRSPDECAEKVRWLLDHPGKCAEIGKAGQQRTLREHSYAQRLRRARRIAPSSPSIHGCPARSEQPRFQPPAWRGP